jgi:ketosteroid isomerase-like protein
MAVSARVEAWKAAWESRDAAAVAALYAPDATHESAVIKEVYPQLGRLVLRGRHEIAVYARRGLARFSELRFEIITVTESGNRAAVEYRRHSKVAEPSPAAGASSPVERTGEVRVLELIEWRGDLIGAVRVFHFDR